MSQKASSKKSHISRRDFLRLAGLATAGSVASVSFASKHPVFAQHVSQSSLHRRARQGEQVLRVGWENPVTFDPARLSTDSEVALVNAIYDYLIDTDAGSQLVPRLAQSWTVSDDGLAYTLTLVEGATFHDGSPFSADDVVWTFNRLRDPEQSNAADFFGNIASVEASDPVTVVFRLNNTAPDFLYNLSDNRAVILKQGTEDPTTAFNGTGPYKVVSFDASDRAILEKNQNYWLADAPTLDRLEFIYFGDVNASVNALGDNSIDAILRMSTSVFQSLQLDFKTLDIPTNGYNLLRLRHDRGPGQDPRVFKAFKLAVDRKRIFDIIGAGFGAEGRDHPIGPLYSQYFDPSLNVAPRDPQQARELLAAAGYPDGLEIDMHVPNSGDRSDLARALRSFLQDAGINANIRLRDEGIYYSDVEDNWLEVDLGITGWGSRPTPQQYLDLQLRTGAVWNEAHYSDSELDALIDLAGTSLDQDVRVQAYRDIQALLIDRGPIIVPYFFPQFIAMQNNVDGVRLHPFAGRSDFRFVTLG